MTSSIGDALTARLVSVSFIDRPRGGTTSSSPRQRPARFPVDPAATDRQRRDRDDRRTGDADVDELDRSRGGGGGGGTRTLTSRFTR